MLRGGLGGVGARGGLGGIDGGEVSDPGGPVEYLRGTPVTSHYPWGASNNIPSSAVQVFNGSAASADKIRTVTHFFVRAGTIGKMGWWPITGHVGGSQFRWAIYSDNNGAPDTKLYDSGAQASWPTGNGSAVSWKYDEVNLEVEAMTIYHLAWKHNAAFGTQNINLGAFSTENGSNVLGTLNGAAAHPNFPSTFAIVTNLWTFRHNGWRVDHAFDTAFPTTFPTSPNYVAYSDGANVGDGNWQSRHCLFTYEFTPA